jgi:hypothetical protein
MRRYSPQSSKPTPRHCLTPGFHELDEGADRSLPRPATLCTAWPAPASRPAAADPAAQRVPALGQYYHFLHKLVLVVLLACVIPMSPAHGTYDFRPALRESGINWQGEHTAACNQFRPSQLDHNRQPDLAQALVAKERQLLANRENHGIYHASHTPLLEEMAALALQMNNIHKAQEYKEAVLLINKRLHKTDNMSLAKAYSQWADWHFERYLENVGRPSVLLGHGHDSLLLTLYFSVSNEYYNKALNLLDTKPAFQCERSTLVNRLKALYFSAMRTAPGPAHYHRLPTDFEHVHSMGTVVPYSISPATIRDLLTPATAAEVPGDPALARAAALQLVELADWYALFNNRKDARTHYERAWQALHAAGFQQQEAESILALGLPVPAPDAMLQAASMAQPSRGYIDVDIELNAHGLPTAVTLVSTEDHDSQLVRSLLRQIWQSKFRPVVRAGSATDSELVALRYNY